MWGKKAITEGTKCQFDNIPWKVYSLCCSLPVNVCICNGSCVSVCSDGRGGYRQQANLLLWCQTSVDRSGAPKSLSRAGHLSCSLSAVSSPRSGRTLQTQPAKQPSTGICKTHWLTDTIIQHFSHGEVEIYGRAPMLAPMYDCARMTDSER